MSNKENIIKEFKGITGSDEILATNMLEACNWNLEMSVNMYLESGQEKLTSINSNNSEVDITASANVRDEDDVRAPIPQQQAILVEDKYHALPYARPGRKSASSTAFDQFRDFKKETEEQEKKLRNKSNAQSSPKRKRLHELFRPPIDILHHGDFQSARTKSSSVGRWLLVSIQNATEFACQVLNRDVWSNKVVREIVAANFLLWQVYSDSDEGMHYQTFYQVKKYPHISVIDPRTGERMIVWENFGMKPSPDQFAELATIFLSEHPSLNQSFEETKHEPQTSISIIDDTEEQQFSAALKASLQETKTTCIDIESESDTTCSDDEVEWSIPSPIKKKIKIDSDDEIISNDNKQKNQPELEGVVENGVQIVTGEKENGVQIVTEEKDSFLQSSSSSESISNSDVIGKENGGEIAKILLRLPDNSRKQISISLESSLKELARYVSKAGFSRDRYELVKSFPRQNISTLDENLTLKEAGLHKQETLFVQDR